MTILKEVLVAEARKLIDEIESVDYFNQQVCVERRCSGVDLHIEVLNQKIAILKLLKSVGVYDLAM